MIMNDNEVKLGLYIQKESLHKIQPALISLFYKHLAYICASMKVWMITVLAKIFFFLLPNSVTTNKLRRLIEQVLHLILHSFYIPTKDT